MLREAIELQQRAVSQLADKLETKDDITFRAPTGSGKTYMMADLMNRVLEKDSDVVCIMFVACILTLCIRLERPLYLDKLYR